MVLPVLPVAPVSPVSPVAPCGPAGPLGNEMQALKPSAKADTASSFSDEWFMMFPGLIDSLICIAARPPRVDQTLVTERSHS